MYAQLHTRRREKAAEAWEQERTRDSHTGTRAGTDRDTTPLFDNKISPEIQKFAHEYEQVRPEWVGHTPKPYVACSSSAISVGAECVIALVL